MYMVEARKGIFEMKAHHRVVNVPWSLAYSDVDTIIRGSSSCYLPGIV